jgi:alanine racemase
MENFKKVSAQTQLRIDMNALKHNYAAIKEYVGGGVTVMPIIKADGYGTGAALLANVYSDCRFFGIADLVEAESLHAIMPGARFFVLYQPLLEEAERIAERDYIVASVSSPEFVLRLNRCAESAGRKIPVHVEIDTGMSRLGVLPRDCEAFARLLLQCRSLTAEGICTHYSSADGYTEQDLAFTARQTALFKEAIGIMEGVLGEIRYKHACASAAIFNPSAELFNMVRPGYILRGYLPCKEIADKIALRPALRFVTQVAQVEQYEAGAYVSYSRTFTTRQGMRLAKIPVGYDDGIMRRLSNKGAFVINGQLAPIVGNVTMDYTMADVTDITPAVRVGDEVAVFDNENMTIERMAQLCDTIGYEIITSIKNKAERIECF